MDKTKNHVQISVSNSGFVDQGDGVVTFPNGLTITDDSEMRSGTRYDIQSLDISKYEGQLTADHYDSLGTLIGKTMGVSKDVNRVVVSGIKYAVKENPYARLAYDLLVGGFSNSFSIETLGPWPDPQDPVYRNHELVGLSQVVVPNNYNAKINQFNEIVHNSLERSQQDGLDTTGVKEFINKAIKTSLPLAPLEMGWDSGAAKKAVKTWASDKEGNIDFTKYRKAFFWVDPENKNVQGGYKLPFADIVDGELEAVWSGVSSAMAALNGSRGGTSIPEEDRKGVYSAIASYYKKFKKPIPALNSFDEMTVEEESMAKDKKNTSEEKETPVIENELEQAEVVETEKTEQVETETSKEPEAPAEGEVEVENEAVVASEAEEESEEAVADDTDKAEAEEAEETETEESEEESKEEVENETNKNKENLEMTKEEMAELIANSVAAALKPVQEELAAVKETAQNAFDAQAKEPEFKKEEKVTSSYDDMSEEELFAKQLNAAVAAERLQSVEGRKTLNEINARNLAALKEKKIVNNALTLEDLGNFVIGPELYNQVATARTNYSAIIDATQWRETNSIEFGWLTRSSDIDMQSVALGAFGDVSSPDTSDERLKPVSTPGYGAHTDKLEEMAAVTPISINVIKFAAADILADVAEGYRNDYDRKRAQLVIARLQQAVNATGNKYVFDISDGLVGWARVTSLISDATTVGTLVFNNKTLTELKGQALANYNGSILAEISNGTILGTPFVVVPNDLLPTINTTGTKTFVVQGSNVTIDQAVFYADLRTFTGRSSGGLKYDVDGSASYEVDGTVYSAYQRNEIVLRGSFFRGGVIKDTSVVASIPAVAVS